MKKLWIAILLLACVSALSACKPVSQQNVDTATTEASTSPVNCQHSFGQWVTRENATCGTAGEMERICTACGHKETENLPIQGQHVYVEPGVCKVCAKPMDQAYIFTLNEDGKSYAFRYNGNAASVTVPDTYNMLPVTQLSDGAFEWCSNLVAVRLPDSITTIGAYAFASSQKLTSVNTPKNLKSIGENAFSGCISLISFSIPEAVTRIEDHTFSDCGLKSINLPKTLTYIGEMAFASCCEFTTLTIPASVSFMGEYAFSACRALKTIEIENGTKLRTIPKGAFSSGAALQEVIVGEGIAVIAAEAFAYHYQLSFVALPSTLEEIGEKAFFNAATTLGISYSGAKEMWNQIVFGKRWTREDFTTHITFLGASKGESQ